MSRRRMRIRFGTVGCLSVVLLVAISAYRYRWELREVRDRLGTTSSRQLRFGVFSPDRKTEIHRNGTLRLVAKEYHPSGDPKTTILLLHGHTPRGSSLAFYRVLGRKLADLGHLVVAPDFAGFGESADPFSIPYEEGASGDYDVEAWLDFLVSNPEISKTPLFVVAHSAGVSSGMPISMECPNVDGIVAIGPSRNVLTDLEDPKQAEYWWRRNQRTYRQVYGREFPDWYTKGRWLNEAKNGGSGVGLKRPMEYFLPLLQEEGHHPVLLVDGERELEEDKLYLQAYYDAMAEPKGYHTLSGSDHYSNVAHIGRWAVYDKEVVEETVTVLVDWIDRIHEANPGS